MNTTEKNQIILIEDEQLFAKRFVPKMKMLAPSYEVVLDDQFGDVTDEALDAFIARAREKVDKHRSQCAAIFLDLGLSLTRDKPWQLGFRVGAALRQAFYEIPIVVFTGYADQVQEGYLYDFDYFMNKNDFSVMTENEFHGILSRTVKKRASLVHNLPEYYRQHVQQQGADVAVRMLHAFGHYFTGQGSHQENVLDDASKIEMFLKGQTRQTVILFADLADSTLVKQKQGYFEGLRLVRLHNQTITGIIARTGGTVVKYIGDAVMARYDYDTEASQRLDLQAVNAAIEIQEAFASLHRGPSHGHVIQTKIGIDFGRVADFYGNDPHGSPVDRAARIQSYAKPGEILVSTDLITHAGLQGQLKSRIGEAKHFQKQDYLGTVRSLDCKGFTSLVPAYEILWDGRTPTPLEPTDSK